MALYSLNAITSSKIKLYLFNAMYKIHLSLSCMECHCILGQAVEKVGMPVIY